MSQIVVLSLEQVYTVPTFSIAAVSSGCRMQIISSRGSIARTRMNVSQPLPIVVRRPLLQQHIRRGPPHGDAIQPAELPGERAEAAVRVECLRECGVQEQRRRRGQRSACALRR